MTIKERLQNDWKEALKNKDKDKGQVLSMARSAIIYGEKESGKELTEDEMTNIISKEVKSRRDSVESFKDADRQDLIDKEKFEIQILLNYLPKQLERNEIKELVESTAKDIDANTMKDMGKLMGALRPKIMGKADAKLVSTIVKEYLNK